MASNALVSAVDHCGVAEVVPRNGQVVEYQSVRTQASAAQTRSEKSRHPSMRPPSSQVGADSLMGTSSPRVQPAVQGPLRQQLAHQGVL